MAVVKKRYNFTYDLNSNILSNNNYTFIYNEANRLTQSTSIDGTTTYSYNGYEQRVRTETINGNDVKTTWFIYEGGKLVYEEFQENSKNPISTKYLYLNGNLVGVVKNDEIYQIQTDQIGTPRVILNSSGNTVWKWENEEAFGNNQPVENGLTFNLRFSGQYSDDEKRSSYNINRDYVPALGRYIQADSIGLEGGINAYGYVDGNPLSYIDPEGLFSMLTLTTIEGVKRNTTLNEAVPAGAMTRIVTLPAITLGLSPSVIGVFGSSIIGTSGVIRDFCFNPNELIYVSRWGAIRPNGLQSGDWVMKGPINYSNYIRSGKLQKGWGNEYAPYSSGEKYLVKRSDLSIPQEYGLGPIKGLLGQRKYKQ